MVEEIVMFVVASRPAVVVLAWTHRHRLSKITCKK